MKWYGILALLLVASAIADDNGTSEEDGDGLVLAEVCDPEACTLPECRCSTTEIPGGLNPRDVPQFVTVTFDDGVNVNNIQTYRQDLYNRENPNGCPAGATFFVNHEYTNYQLVNELYNQGYEIALHSISHQTSQSYWAQATYDDMKREFADQKVQMSHFANIPYDSLQGIRLPFLQMNGNSSFQVMADYGIDYDCSWPTVQYTNPALWPYSLDYASSQDCIVPPCPTASIPGAWVAPMVSWSDLNGFPCAMADACFFVPDREDEDAWFKFILTNFERHYFGNRAPFPFFIHEAYLTGWPAVRRAFVRFLNLINNLEDVYMVNMSEVMEWVRNPIPIPEYKEKSCRTFIPTTCNSSVCVLTSEHNGVQYFMTVCNVCPRVYPWLGNPLGQ